MAHEEWLERAELYLFRALEGVNLAEYEAHLASGCALCETHVKQTREALVLISRSLPGLTPSAAVKSRVFEYIGSDKQGYVFVHADEGQWVDVAPGIRAKVLHMDDARQRITALVRMAPGSCYDNHRHTQTEELLVLEGSCYCGGRLLRTGDYHRAEAGTIHLDTRTDEGSLMLVTSSMQNEIIT